MRCIICRIELKKHKHAGRPNKYCKKCAILERKNYLRTYYKKYYFRYLQLIRDRQDSKLGTTSFSSHFCGDFKKEYEEIQKEKRKLFSGYKQYGSRKKYLRHKFLSEDNYCLDYIEE